MVQTGTARRQPGDGLVIALAGNPNVGKSTVFNALTGMNQHTGNWPGKTIATAQGRCRLGQTDLTLVDLPGTYSLLAHSAEEEVARDFLCFGGADAAIVVCDATRLERSLNLVLQILEITDRVVVCVNLLDEARKKHIRVDLNALQRALGVPVVGAAARSGEGLNKLLEQAVLAARGQTGLRRAPLRYAPAFERAVGLVEATLAPLCGGCPAPRWLAVRMLCGDLDAVRRTSEHLEYPFESDPAVRDALRRARAALASEGIEGQRLLDQAAAGPVLWAEGVAAETVFFEDPSCDERDRRLDRLLMSRRTGVPVMLLLLFGVFWLTIAGANVPSQWLADRLFALQDRLSALFLAWGAPDWLHGALVLGVYRVLAWVVSVMLPPMAIFFPLFTLLEDFGYLPRVAFNLDHCFKRVCACGKQSLTMCMSFGCNAVGVTGCRIIDSPRERLIAILTASLVPCNGRFPPPRKGKPSAILIPKKGDDPFENARLRLGAKPRFTQPALDKLGAETRQAFGRGLPLGGPGVVQDNAARLVFRHWHPSPLGRAARLILWPAREKDDFFAPKAQRTSGLCGGFLLQ